MGYYAEEADLGSSCSHDLPSMVKAYLGDYLKHYPATTTVSAV